MLAGAGTHSSSSSSSSLPLSSSGLRLSSREESLRWRLLPWDERLRFLFRFLDFLCPEEEDEERAELLEDVEDELDRFRFFFILGECVTTETELNLQAVFKSERSELKTSSK